MSSRSRWKLLTALVLGFAALGVIGWQRIPPGPVTPATITLTPTVTRVSASQTTVVPSRPTEWIKITQVKPVDYYLSLLYSNGTSPYGHLYWELRKLPDLTNATAVAKITYLALNATNSEVKEAFELMIKGGTPDPKDYNYQVPNYNTELQVLYWLACQNEFKKDDTLALAIAMVNGLWVTMGDEQVREAATKDLTDLLAFFRETNELQKTKGYHQLEDYPLEAKVCLAWTGGYSPFIERNHGLMFYKDKKLQIEGYRWNTISKEDLVLARKIAETKIWLGKDLDVTMQNIERYFFFDKSPYWDTVPTEIPEAYVVVDGKRIINHDMGNPSFVLRFFIENGKAFGDCGDQTNLVGVFAKSWGIATNVMGNQRQVAGDFVSHFYNVYYNPPTRSWNAYRNQLDVNLLRGQGVKFYNHILKPPVRLQDYLFRHLENTVPLGSTKYTQELTLEEVKEMYLAGVPTSVMKQWLLYS